MLKEIINELKIDNQPKWEMETLSTKKTGLKYKIWFSTKWKNLQPRIKIEDRDCKVSISIEDNPKILNGYCNDDLSNVFNWVKLNKNVLLDYWNEKISIVECIKSLKGE